MGTDATLGFGSQLYFKASADTNFVKIAQTIDLAGPEPEIGDVKVTNNDSPDNTHEYVPGMIEPGTQDYEIVYTKAQCASLYDTFGDGVIYDFAEKYPDGAGWTFKGYLKKFGTESKTEDDAMKNSITIKLCSKPVFSSALTVPTGP